MKKTALFIISVVLVLILSVVTYFYIWGGKPQIENFEQVSEDYEIVALLTLDSYNELMPNDSYPENEVIIVDIDEENLKCDDYIFSLTDEQQKAVITAGKKFNYLAVYEGAVFFCEDETGYYGLVYSEHPIAALYKEELPQQGREYHRINSRWYEWGVWAI
ncbi:MAG: hypothetical protein E7539_07845 [Ruminococcaceae bacterium]|nr:hypothetical protein [Oscillospiraceae bacterium]